MTVRIAMISEHASPLATLGGKDSGGQNVYVSQLACHLARNGFKVDIFTRRDAAELPEVAPYQEGVRIIHVNAGPAIHVQKEKLLPLMAEFSNNIYEFCARRQHRYDLIHANFWTSGVATLNLKKKLNIPFVITFHALGHVRRRYQNDADRFPQERPQWEAEIVATADRVIAECPQDRSDLIQFYNAHSTRTCIVPCGYDPQEMWPVDKAIARNKLGLSKDGYIVLQLGRMVPRKGVDVPIRALAALRKDYKIDACLLVVGGESDIPDPRATPEIGRLSQIAEAEGVQGQVYFVGRRQRNMLRYYYSAADVFITTPWYEPFGITAIEAMACGKPVIASEVGGLKFSVRDGITGYLVAPHDFQAVADRLAHLKRCPATRHALGAAAQLRAMENFTWAHVADRMAVLYKQVLDEHAEMTASAHYRMDRSSITSEAYGLN